MDRIPRLLAFDLDGTLAESKQPLTREMGQLVADILKRMPVAVMSGASFTQFETQFLPFVPPIIQRAQLYLFPTNAASCMALRNGAWTKLYDNELTPAEVQRIYSAFDEALRITGLSKAPPRVWGERIENRGAQITFSALGQRAPIEEKRKWHDAFGGSRQQLRAALQNLLPDFSVKTGGMTTVDVNREGLSKAHGIEKLAELTGIPIADMVYVGDELEEGGNDSVVKETGVATKAVSGPAETAAYLQEIIAASGAPGEVQSKGDLLRPQVPSVHWRMIWVWTAVAVLAALALAVFFLYAGSPYVTDRMGSLPEPKTPPGTTVSTDRISVDAPAIGARVSSPLSVSGKARGNWYFEASFPVILEDAMGNVLAQTPAQAQGDWMTTDFVPFIATLSFTAPSTATGTLILKNDNPSGLPENSAQVEVPVRFR